MRPYQQHNFCGKYYRERINSRNNRSRPYQTPRYNRNNNYHSYFNQLEDYQNNHFNRGYNTMTIRPHIRNYNTSSNQRFHYNGNYINNNNFSYNNQSTVSHQLMSYPHRDYNTGNFSQYNQNYNISSNNEIQRSYPRICSNDEKRHDKKKSIISERYSKDLPITVPYIHSKEEYESLKNNNMNIVHDIGAPLKSDDFSAKSLTGELSQNPEIDETSKDDKDTTEMSLSDRASKMGNNFAQFENLSSQDSCQLVIDMTDVVDNCVHCSKSLLNYW
ncbi:probable serine/threonine-protein kinase clkA [Teleopsis dalmanni]|uniref:probable serine/threonine-protein kinase clkA n=1 Tax=Teleopsis dalmanni TaxID=139649 RepID=UPI0018CFA9E6|nr:probable serine/threonine-protein kinase clkA [Teleopsis dalmanni]XP_037961011.1 probable serine/threonine-protein kinase clkA [Teleopsis dalmanni]XP_037961197.1 probable serine/threonine-protein kinase clkA [Teleopsis dalmanni]